MINPADTIQVTDSVSIQVTTPPVWWETTVQLGFTTPYTVQQTGRVWTVQLEWQQVEPYTINYL